jgi:CRISPR-associated endonuclease/helicase Cas3
MATQASQRLITAPDGHTFDETHYGQFFTLLTGKKPYPYQVTLAKELIFGKSLILRAPTGSGKTWAAVAPFIYSRLIRNKFADRLIYTLPLKALASNLHDSTQEKLRNVPELTERGSGKAKNRKYRPDDPFYLGLQMGGQQDDPFFEGDITFTTIDQLLSAYLFSPVSLPNRVGNISAGALIGSFLVFDETHLLDPEKSLATTIEMLFRLKGLAQFVLMTATMPDSVMKWLEEKLEAKSIVLSSMEVLQLPSHAGKQREFEWRPAPLCAEDIVGEHKDRTIAIVNTVGRAQELFTQVCEIVKALPSRPQVFLLHSRFFPEDRKNWESKLADYFGPEAALGNAILISTQVVEAGIDISADVLLTELAPLNSLLQRAGRVARYPNRNTGRFLVFALPANEKGQLKLGPYRDKRQSEIVNATQNLLDSSGRLPSLSYSQELEWLQCIHDVPDLQDLAHLNSLHAHSQYVLNAMDGLDDAVHSRLVRETDSVNVVLTSQPEILRFNAKEWPELLSVPRSSIFKLRAACEKADASEWVLKVPQEIQAESNQSLDFQWQTIGNSAGIAWLAAINPAYASYSEKTGLELDKPSNPEPKVKYKLSPPVLRYSYQKESFVTHAKRVTERGARILEQCPHGLNQLKQRYPAFNLHDVFIITCALHDTGKLQIAWQNEAERWQKRISEKLGYVHNSEPIAHTDFDPERDRGEQWCKFPAHAACGAFALLPYLSAYFPDEIAKVICTAITRHHGTHTSALGKFELVPEAATILGQSLPTSFPRTVEVQYAVTSNLTCQSFAEDHLLYLNDNAYLWPLYASVVRILRLADQGSFQD